MAVERKRRASFEEFFNEAEPRLRRALCVAFGRELGLEATAEALAWGWENWDRMQGMQNPIGYLYRVGRSSIRGEWRRRSRRASLFDAVDGERLPWVEPGLPQAMADLPVKQRLTVGLVHGYDWTQREVADLLHVAPLQKDRNGELAAVLWHFDMDASFNAGRIGCSWVVNERYTISSVADKELLDEEEGLRYNNGVVSGTFQLHLYDADADEPHVDLGRTFIEFGLAIVD